MEYHYSFIFICMSFESPNSTQDAHQEVDDRIILEDGTEVLEVASKERVTPVEWVRFVEENFFSSEAPFKRALKELLDRHPEERVLLEEIEDKVHVSASRASGMARRLANVDRDEWSKAAQEGGI